MRGEEESKRVRTCRCRKIIMPIFTVHLIRSVKLISNLRGRHHAGMSMRVSFSLSLCAFFPLSSCLSQLLPLPPSITQYYLRRLLHRVVKCRRHLCSKPPETFERKLSLFGLKEPLIKIWKSLYFGNFHGTWISFCSCENIRSWPESLAKPVVVNRRQSRLVSVTYVVV